MFGTCVGTTSLIPNCNPQFTQPQVNTCMSIPSPGPNGFAFGTQQYAEFGELVARLARQPSRAAAMNLLQHYHERLDITDVMLEAVRKQLTDVPPLAWSQTKPGPFPTDESSTFGGLTGAARKEINSMPQTSQPTMHSQFDFMLYQPNGFGGQPQTNQMYGQQQIGTCACGFPIFMVLSLDIKNISRFMCTMSDKCRQAPPVSQTVTQSDKTTSPRDYFVPTTLGIPSTHGTNAEARDTDVAQYGPAPQHDVDYSMPALVKEIITTFYPVALSRIEAVDDTSMKRELSKVNERLIKLIRYCMDPRKINPRTIASTVELHIYTAFLMRRRELLELTVEQCVALEKVAADNLQEFTLKRVANGQRQVEETKREPIYAEIGELVNSRLGVRPSKAILKKFVDELTTTPVVTPETPTPVNEKEPLNEIQSKRTELEQLSKSYTTAEHARDLDQVAKWFASGEITGDMAQGFYTTIAIKALQGLFGTRTVNTPESKSQ